MRILFDITHPAQVHFFKNVIAALKQQGHQVKVTTRKKDVTLALLDGLGIEHTCLSAMGKGLFGMGRELMVRHARMLATCVAFRPDVLVARMGISIGPTGLLMGMPRIVFEDTEHARLQAMLSLPFATCICTGAGYTKDYGRRQVRFRGVPHLAYLAPNVFTPDPRPLREHGLDPDQPFILLRTVAWEAAHDVGIKGASEEQVAEYVQRLSKFGRVIISSEKPLPPTLKPYENPVPVHRMLDVLAFSQLYIGEGGSMAAEAAVLGTPAVFCNRLRVGYLAALEQQWNLTHNCDTLDEGMPVAEQWLARPNLKQEWTARRQQMLDDSEDVNAFMLNLITGAAGGKGLPSCSGAGDRAATSSAGRKRLKRAVYAVLIGLVFYFVGKNLWRCFQAIDFATVALNWWALAAGFAGLCAIRLLGSVILNLLLQAFQNPISYARGAAIICASSMGRYVPGKMAAIAGAVGLLVNSGVRMRVAVAALFLSTALTIVLNSIVAIVALGLAAPVSLMPALRQNAAWLWLPAAIIAAGGAVCLHPRLFIALSNAILRLLRRPPLPAELNAAPFMAAVASIAARTACLGLSFWFASRAVMPIGIDQFPLILGAAALASVSGFLAVFVPAGLGVQEGIYLLVLTQTLGPRVGLVAVVFRLLQVLTDAVMGVIGLILLRRPAKTAQRSESTAAVSQMPH